MDLQPVQERLQKLCAHGKLERDAALAELADLSAAQLGDNLSELSAAVLSWLNGQTADRWECRYGCLSAAKVLVERPELPLSQSVMLEFEVAAAAALTDEEYRVRTAGASLLGALCRRQGAAVFERAGPAVVALMERDVRRPSSPVEASPPPSQDDAVVEKLIASHRTDADGGSAAAEIFHDTAGWRSLETSMLCLQAMTDGCGAAFRPFFTRNIFDVVLETTNHENRFVRETAFHLFASILACFDETGGVGERFEWHVEMADCLAKGMADNWSQVRLAASVATRTYLRSFNSLPDAQLRAIVPAMCLNRYYLAEGVRVYSQETWRQMVAADGSGVGLVTKMLDQIAAYYVSQTKAENHAVREAACHAIAELAAKVERAALSAHVAVLLAALVQCFDDESWPVRDAACVASARFLALFPDSAVERVHELLPFFWQQLQDCIASVREGGAEALGSLCRTYGDVVRDWLLPRVDEGLRRVHEQPSEAVQSGGGGAATFGVAKRARDNDPAVHTGQTMYSCGSLAPKMGRSSGCSDHTFRRSSEPWQTADGCVLFVAELSAQEATPIDKLLRLVADACERRHFVQHVQLLETVCKCLPRIATNLSKRRFKPFLQPFLEPILYACQCDCELTVVAAEECIRFMANFFGPSIVRGRVEMLDKPDYLRAYDTIAIRCGF